MWGADAGRTIKQIVRSGNRVASDRKGKTMKKILTMVVGLLTAIALLAVVAVAQDGGSEAPPQTAAAAEQPPCLRSGRKGERAPPEVAEVEQRVPAPEVGELLLPRLDCFGNQPSAGRAQGRRLLATGLVR